MWDHTLLWLCISGYLFRGNLTFVNIFTLFNYFDDNTSICVVEDLNQFETLLCLCSCNSETKHLVLLGNPEKICFDH